MYRNPRSKCISFSSWEPLAASVKSGKRKPGPGSKGTVVISFRRNPSRYTYTWDTPLGYAEWLNFMKPSTGKKWNYIYKGRV